MPVIYQLPKTHKNSETPPGRPIISGINSLTSRLGAYIDCFLQPIVITLPSHLKDTGDFLRVVQELQYSPDLWVVTADVCSLYTVIPLQEGLKACQYFLREQGKLPEQQQKFLLDCLELCVFLACWQFLFTSHWGGDGWPVCP